MVFGSESILPADITFRAPRVDHYDEENFDHARVDDINRLEEERLVTCVQTAKYLDGL
jgi:hypothetical protein